MPLTKAKGNMYPWVTHTHTRFGGACPHGCTYCYVQAMSRRFPGMKARYTGPGRLIEAEFAVNYGAGKTIFVEHCNDLFAEAWSGDAILRVLAHCRAWPENTYVLQTKNPGRIESFREFLPKKLILGTTIESDLWHPCMGHAPEPGRRALAMSRLRKSSLDAQMFVTVEPVLAFTPHVLLEWLAVSIRPDWVNLGADSKGHELDEPRADDLRELISGLQAAGIEIRQKSNLNRLLQ